MSYVPQQPAQNNNKKLIGVIIAIAAVFLVVAVIFGILILGKLGDKDDDSDKKGKKDNKTKTEQSVDDEDDADESDDADSDDEEASAEDVDSEDKRIRRVSLDQFYALVTGQQDAFFQMCMVLPEVVKSVVEEGEGVSVPNDSVYEELKGIAQRTGGTNDDISMAIAIYRLGFSTYKGFSNNDGLSIDFMTENCGIERIYQYAKGI